MSSVQEWETQFVQKYDLVGKLIQEGEDNEGAETSEGTPEKSEVNLYQGKTVDISF